MADNRTSGRRRGGSSTMKLRENPPLAAIQIRAEDLESTDSEDDKDFNPNDPASEVDSSEDTDEEEMNDTDEEELDDTEDTDDEALEPSESPPPKKRRVSSKR